MDHTQPTITNLPEKNPLQERFAALDSKRLADLKQAVEQKSPPPTPELKLAEGVREVKLDLACGQSPREGFEGVDLPGVPGVKHGIDLLRFPWPWEPDSVDAIHCSHFIEHIPMEMITDAKGDKKDLFFAFFDECWRILKKTDDPNKPLGRMTVVCPCARSDRAFQDPTHRRFIVAQTFMYLHKDWRKQNKLDHYNVRCDFAFRADPIIPTEMSIRSPEWQQMAFNHYWNTVQDWQVELIPILRTKG